MVKKALFLCLSIVSSTKCRAVHFENIGTLEEGRQTGCRTAHDVVREIPANATALKVSGTMGDSSAEVLAHGLQEKCHNLQTIDLSGTNLMEVCMFQGIVRQSQFRVLIVHSAHVDEESIGSLQNRYVAQQGVNPDVAKEYTRKIVWLKEDQLQGAKDRLRLSPTSFQRHKAHYATEKAKRP